ncbi:MAG: copper resistance CopC/CopD family protein [Gaiellaceae bacterium]
MTRILVALAVAALIAPAMAMAHATPVRTRPADGSVLDRAPRVVRVEFDDAVRVASGNAVVANDSGKSALAGRARARGRTLVLPMRRGLKDGVYSVRWSIFSDDGHREEGILAFGVGNGGATPKSVLGASAPLAWNNVLLRTLYVFGVLAAAGATIFWLLTRGLHSERLRIAYAHLVFFALLAAFLGGSGIVHSAPPGTRFDLVLKVAVTIALVGGAAAALAPTVRVLVGVAAACSLALLAAPTLAGHALDRNQPRVLAPLVDLAHTASAAVWIGGLLSLVYVLPRAEDPALRTTAVRRFSTTALVAVTVLALTGIGRALTELSAVSQVWSTSYGRTLIVKTALFAVLVGLGWLNRSVLIDAFSRLRRSAAAEVTLLCCVVVAVAVLTELRPGTDAAAAKAAPLAAAQPPALPPRDAVVDAREVGTLALAVARTPGQTTVTLLGPDATGVNGSRVAVNGTVATPCGSGCYRASTGANGALHVEVNGRTTTFDLPARARPAAALLRRVARAFRASRTLVFDERLASSPTIASTTRFRMIAPDKLAYQTRNGPAGIVIGSVRWDKDSPTAPWVKSPQTPVHVTEPGWGNPTNVHEIAPGVLTFVDRRIPAWFHLTLGGKRPRRVQMTAAAHFMDDRYVGFDVPVEISPPPSR